MRACFAFVVGAVISTVGAAQGGEISVLNHGAAAPAAAPAVVVAPAPAPAAAVVEAAPCASGRCKQSSEIVCTTGKCTRVYGVETHESASCRNRLFGGTVTRNSTRTVVRPARR